MKSSVFHRFLSSYLAMLVIPLWIGFFAYFQAGNTIMEESNYSNIVLLNQSRQILDARLEEVQQLAAQISMNGRVKDFLYAKDAYNNLNIDFTATTHVAGRWLQFATVQVAFYCRRSNSHPVAVLLKTTSCHFADIKCNLRLRISGSHLPSNIRLLQ